MILIEFPIRISLNYVLTILYTDKYNQIINLIILNMIVVRFVLPAAFHLIMTFYIWKGPYFFLFGNP